MWLTIISAIVMVGFIFVARFLLGQSLTEGDGGMGTAVLGYVFVLIAVIPAIFLLYKAAIFGLEN